MESSKPLKVKLKVSYNHEWEEFRVTVRFLKNGTWHWDKSKTYFSNDLMDAESTCVRMAEEFRTVGYAVEVVES